MNNALQNNCKSKHLSFKEDKKIFKDITLERNIILGFL